MAPLVFGIRLNLQAIICRKQFLFSYIQPLQILVMNWLPVMYPLTMASTGNIVSFLTSMDLPSSWSLYLWTISGISSMFVVIKWFSTTSPKSWNQNEEIWVSILPFPSIALLMIWYTVHHHIKGGNPVSRNKKQAAFIHFVNILIKNRYSDFASCKQLQIRATCFQKCH